MVRVAVIGATGYAGAELVRILSAHPGVELTALTSRQYAGRPFEEIYPALRGRVGLNCRSLDTGELGSVADLVFLALPHKLPMDIAPSLLESGLRVVDLSADFRFRDRVAYESHYQPHTAPGLLEEAVYGLSEIYDRRIRSARLVGNPGCYPTSILLPMVPLIREGLVDPDSLVADSKSGVSGAGRAPSLATHFCEVTDSFRAYKVAEHRHAPEMEEVLSREGGGEVRLTFVPHLVPMVRGMLSTVYARLRTEESPDRLRQCLADSYAGRPFIRLCAPGQVPVTGHVRGTNCCDIGLAVDSRRRQLVLLSAIDNLVKGAAGQAVQNMNLMLGFPETEGLTPVPFPV